MSVPTSLIIVVLAAFWLVVLVPMVARRRETVPETEVDSRTFRVLRRASASIRRRPTFSRRGDFDDAGYDDDLESGVPLTEQPLDSELLDETDDERSNEELSDAELSDEEFSDEGLSDGLPDGEFEEARFEETRYEEVEYAEVHGFEPPALRPGRRRDPLAGVDQAHLRPVPRRQGRGGYDPDAAELARAYRYSRRRRVTVVLLLATIAFSAAAYLFKPVLWSGTVVFGLLLIAYLGYLRRQVRIENDIQHRRQDRLRRARQIRPEYHLDRSEEAVTGRAFGRRDLVASQVPPSGYRYGREVVDLEDDDPSFDDLDYYQPIQYRRASGQ